MDKLDYPVIFSRKSPAHSKTLYVHAGMPKTGSTAIQNFLAHNQQALEEQGKSLPLRPRHEIRSHRSGNGLEVLDAIRNNPDFLATEERDVIASSENLFWKLSETSYAESLVAAVHNRNVIIAIFVPRLELWMSRWITHLVTYHGVGNSDIGRSVTDALDQIEATFKNLQYLSRHADFQVRLLPYHYGITDSIAALVSVFHLADLELKPLPAESFKNRSAHGVVVDAIANLEIASSLAPEDETNLKRLAYALSEMLRAQNIPEPDRLAYDAESLEKIRGFHASLKRVLGRKLFSGLKKELSLKKKLDFRTREHGSIDWANQEGMILEVLALIKKGTDSVVFDPDEYLRLNPDVVGDAYDHYIEYGLKEGRRIR